MTAKRQTNVRSRAPIAANVPFELEQALDGAARAAFLALAPSHQREYCKWIAEAKKEETRRRRAQQAASKLLASL